MNLKSDCKKETGKSVKKRIAVIFGGCSPEYGVSLQSAHAVISHMDKDKYEPVLIGITREGDWFHYSGGVEKIAEDTWRNAADCVPAALSPNRSKRAVFRCGGGKIDEVYIDAVFPVLHGANGEDGTVQGIFELAGIPIVGCGVLACALCMDKDRAHKLASAAGVAVPRAFVFKKGCGAQEALARAEELGYPLFVKPVKAGSSFGVTKVLNQSGLPEALKLAFEYDGEVIVEENISGFEVGCAVLGSGALTTGEIDEIELADGFFDFEEKYTLKTSAIHLPARIDESTANRIKETAKAIYSALGCKVFARVDMFLSDRGEIVFNEVNAIPGFTAHSRFPNMLRAAGMPLEQVVSAAIELAVRG